MGTALVYHEDMTATRLLWDDPECEIECPERLTAALDGLRQRGLEERCQCLSVCEASEEELGLVHSPEYIALVQKTQTLDKEELHTLSKQYDAVYFHPDTFHCARLAAGAALRLVDAVLTGAVHNGVALVRPPGHHSQRAAANGFCVFNNVAIAARHAKQKYGLQRILIVDWDVHHGQGIQYIFEDDPSVLYFSWHRYEHGNFWPFLPESDADTVGRGRGQGFTVNLPWNQVGMGNADYLAAFLHVLLPLAFEVTVCLTLSWCWCQLDSTLLLGTLRGRCRPPLSALPILHSCYRCWLVAGFVLCWSALESIQSVRTAQTPHWTSLQQNVAPVLSSSTHSPEGSSLPVLADSSTCTVAEDSLSPCLDRPCHRPTPPICIAVALAVSGAALDLPPGVLHQEGSALREETEAWARLHKSQFQDDDLAALGKSLCLLDGILDGQIRSAIATTTALATAATLGVLIQRCVAHRGQRLLCVALGQLDRPLDLAGNGRILWLSIRGKEADIWSMFHFSTPLPQTTGGFLSFILGLVLPLAYGFQPDMVLMALGPAHGLQNAQAALLAAMLRSPVGGRILALVEEESILQLARTLAQVLHGETPPSLGPFSMASPEEIQALMFLKAQLEPRWKLLQVAAPPP
ncbi:polyamine deacetylase HDAC10 isoform X2 [Rattus norvegicus]|uniref:Histone deacetylase 10 n=1 Tax=Rattus norvegicus TaxID=10116 RepID=A0ABK0L6Y1_RAT|nr:polyamine deacetylase HDAC10 isoform X3 [Rattus norvegicus]